MNWLKNRLKEWFSEPQPLEQPKSGALAKRYGENLQDPNALIHRANKRATGGDVEGAFADFKEAIHLSPTRATAYYNRGFLHNTLGNFEAAIEDFNRALELLPDYDEAFYQRGNSHLQLKDHSNAVQDFSRAIAQNPYSIKAYYKRAEAYAEMGDTAGTLADYAQAITRVPKDANAYFQRGRFLSKIGELQTAIGDFTTALSYNPRHADAYCSRGCCYAELGDIEKANLDFNQALLHNPSHQAAYYQRMYSLGILKDTAANLQGLHRVFAPTPQDTSASQSPVVISAEIIEPSSPSLSDVAESPEHLHPTTVKLEPESIGGYFERATKRAINGDLDGAIADYTQIIDADPHNTQAYYRRGQNYSAIGEDEAALADLNQAIHWARVHSLGQLKDFSGALSETIQTLKTELKKPKPSDTSRSASGMTIEGAIADYTRTIEVNPTADAYFKRAQSRALMGDLQGAIADYSETIRLNPDHPDAYYRRGLHRSALGDTDGATQDLNQTILRKPIQSEDGPVSGSIGQSNLSGKAQAQTQTDASAVNLNPSRYCDHVGNRPGNRFCIHCGEALEPTEASPQRPFTPKDSISRTAPAGVEPKLSEADRLLQRGRSRCASGNLTEGLEDLGNALTLFLGQQNMGRYQETLKIIQQFSQNL